MDPRRRCRSRRRHVLSHDYDVSQGIGVPAAPALYGPVLPKLPQADRGHKPHTGGLVRVSSSPRCRSSSRGRCRIAWRSVGNPSSPRRRPVGARRHAAISPATSRRRLHCLDRSAPAARSSTTPTCSTRWALAGESPGRGPASSPETDAWCQGASQAGSRASRRGASKLATTRSTAVGAPDQRTGLVPTRRSALLTCIGTWWCTRTRKIVLCCVMVRWLRG